MDDSLAANPRQLHFYDRHGQRISPQRWHELYGDVSRRIVVRTRIGAERSVCTLWTGILDESAEIKLYGTWLMDGERFGDWLGYWDTESQALAAHARMVAQHGQRFFCPVCWFASRNIENLRHGYCGRCKEVTGPTWEQRFD